MYNPNNPFPRWSASAMLRVASEPMLAAAALRYASLGISVFPCRPGDKQPLTPQGFHDASSSPRIVADWWQHHPEANIGLPTGGATGVLVVDIDVHHGESGYAAFERARSAGLAGGWGWLVRTPSGGLHAYYPAGLGAEQRCWQAPRAHVDFRGDGGYVIAPPSRLEVDGQPTAYDVIAVATHRPHAVDATALRQFLEPPRPLRPPPERTAVGRQPDRLAAWVAGRPEGGRNAGLFWAACQMVRQGHAASEIASVLGPAAQHAGLPDREIEATLRSASRIAERLSPAPATPAVAGRQGSIRPKEAIGL